MPGYPAKDDSPILESDYEGRVVNEIDFQATGLRLGQFRAMDFFGDGSFFLLESPGVSVLLVVVVSMLISRSFHSMLLDICVHLLAPLLIPSYF